ncbi:hypothetical protein HMPREF1870_02718 [Bacteroidales bacterium KA00344]|nr:hypothetical protein HMPREF1870_02718 [Bacteroidales bacterium KA00344]
MDANLKKCVHVILINRNIILMDAVATLILHSNSQLLLVLFLWKWLCVFKLQRSGLLLLILSVASGRAAVLLHKFSIEKKLGFGSRNQR